MINPSTLLPSRFGLDWPLSRVEAVGRFRAEGRRFVEETAGDWLEIDLGDSEEPILVYFFNGSLQRVEATLCVEEVCLWVELEDDAAEQEAESSVAEEDHFEEAQERSWATYLDAVGAAEASLGAPTFRSDTDPSGLDDDLYIQALAAWDRSDGLFEVTWGQIGSRPFTVQLTVWGPGSEGQYHYQRPDVQDPSPRAAPGRPVPRTAPEPRPAPLPEPQQEKPKVWWHFWK
jgi:hypothetical protein